MFTIAPNVPLALPTHAALVTPRTETAPPVKSTLIQQQGHSYAQRVLTG